MIYGYCRVSTKGQAKDGNSLDAQEQEILSRYSDAHIYKEAYTGTTTDRPVFNEVIQQMQENDLLVVSKLGQACAKHRRRNQDSKESVPEKVFCPCSQRWLAGRYSYGTVLHNYSPSSSRT